MAYVISDVSGTLKTIDSSDTWFFINKGVRSYTGSSIAQSKTNPEVLYSLGKKILKSVNRGESWNSCGDYVGDRPEQHKSIAISQVDENIVYVGLENGKVIRTENGCDSWEEYATPFGTDLGITFAYLTPDDSYLIVGGETNNGMKRYDLSDDSVDTITLSGTNATYNWDYATYSIGATEYLCVTAGHKIACSSDSGDNWTYTSALTSDSLYIINNLEATYLVDTNVRFLTHVRLISSPFGTVYSYRSVDSGSSWTDFNNNITYNITDNPPGIWNQFGNLGRIFDFECDNNNENVCFAAGGTILRSDDGGLNWVEKVKGAQNTVTTNVSVSPNNQYLFQCGMDIGVLRSADAGDNWESIIPHTSNGDPQGFAVAGHYWECETRGTSAEWDAGTGQIVATSSYWSDSIPRVAISNDNGDTWTITQDGLPTTILNGSASPNSGAWGVGYPRALDVCPSNDDILALGIDGYNATENGGIFISTNGGVSWTRTTQPGGWRIYNAIAFDPTDETCNTIVFSEWFSTSPKTYRTTDRGNSWNAVATVIGTLELKFGSNGRAYKTGLYTNPSVHYSNDGAVWSLMKKLNFTNQLADALWVDPTNPNVVAVGVNDGVDTGPGTGVGKGEGAVYITADAQNGANAVWYNITGNLPALSGVTSITSITHDGNRYLVIGTDGANVWRLNMDDTLEARLNGISFRTP